MQDVSTYYAQCNRDIIAKLQTENIEAVIISDYGQQYHQDGLLGYTLIADAMTKQALLVYRIIARV